MSGLRRSPGAGSVYLDNEGRWTAAVSFGVGPDGRRLRSVRRCSTKSAAQKAVRDLIAAGPVVREPGVTVVALFESWMARETEHMAERTQTWTRWMFNRYVSPTFSETAVSALSVRAIDAWLDALHDEGLSARTRHAARGVLGRVLKHAHRRGDLQENPMERARHVARNTERDEVHPDQVYDREESLALFQRMETHWLGTVVEVALRLGLRRGEVLGLQWADLDLAGPTPSVQVRRSLSVVRGIRDPTCAYIQVGKVKTRQSRRTLPLDSHLVGLLRALRDDQTLHRSLTEVWVEGDWVFTDLHGLPRDPGAVSKAFQAALRTHGLRTIRFHDLRHSAAVLMLEAGAPLEEVSQQLGHTSTDFTKRVYAPYVQGLATRATAALSAHLALP